MACKKNSVKHKELGYQLAKQSMKLGRPLASPLVRDENVNLRLNYVEKESLDMWCWRYDISTSECIRQLMMIHSIIPES